MDVRRLAPNQAAAIDLEEAEESVPCTVVSVKGEIAILAVARPPVPPETLGLLAVGSPGYLAFSHRGALVGLRGLSRSIPGRSEIAFCVTDGFHLPERRAAPRIPLATAATLAPLAADGVAASQPVATTTINVSNSGALLHCSSPLEFAAKLMLELSFGDDPVAIRTQAAIVRRTRDSLAVCFEEMTERDSERLGEFLIGYRAGMRTDQEWRLELTRPRAA